MEIKKSFNQKATESIDRAFDSLADSIELVVYLTLEKDYRVSKEDVPLRPEKLSEILTRVFGPSGSEFMTKLISKEIIAEFDLPETLRGRSISELLKEAREKHEQQTRSE
ncbi:MAG: hypothetical protein ACHQ1H_03060 [Nitrososphaerales archaeon]